MIDKGRKKEQKKRKEKKRKDERVQYKKSDRTPVGNIGRKHSIEL